jgi:hypothetical protein
MRGAAGFLIRRDARLGVRRAACRREALGGGTKGCRRAGVLCGGATSGSTQKARRCDHK